MNKIKFSHRYYKMPDDLENTRLIDVHKADISSFSKEFIEYDTRYAGGNYELPKGGDCLILFLETQGKLWTTIRSLWPTYKEDYYRKNIGEYFEIEIVNLPPEETG